MRVSKFISAFLSTVMLITSAGIIPAAAADSTVSYGVTTVTETDGGVTTVTQTSSSSDENAADDTLTGTWRYIGSVNAENLAAVKISIENPGQTDTTKGSNVAVSMSAPSELSADDNGLIADSSYMFSSGTDTEHNVGSYSSDTETHDIDGTGTVKSYAAASSAETVYLYAWAADETGGCNITVTTLYAASSETANGVTVTEVTKDSVKTVTQLSKSSTANSSDDTVTGTWRYLGSVDTTDLASVGVDIKYPGQTGTTKGSNVAMSASKVEFSDETNGLISSGNYTFNSSTTFAAYSNNTTSYVIEDGTSKITTFATNNSVSTVYLYAWVADETGGCAITVTSTYTVEVTATATATAAAEATSTAAAEATATAAAEATATAVPDYGVTTVTETDGGVTTVTQTSSSKTNTSGGSWFYIGSVAMENLTSVKITSEGFDGNWNNVGGTVTFRTPESDGSITSTVYDDIYENKVITAAKNSDDFDANVTSAVKTIAGDSDTVYLYAWAANTSTIATITVTAVYSEGTKTTYPMDDMSDMTYSSTTTETNVLGMKSNAVSFTGGYATLPETFINEDAFTFSAWVCPSEMSSWERVFDCGTDSNTYAFLTINNGSGLPRFAVKAGKSATEEKITSSIALTAGVWYYITVTYDGGAAKMYINGEEAASGTFSSDMSGIAAGTANYIAKSQFSSDPTYKGKIDEITICNKALTAAQIVEDMKDSTSVTVSSVSAVTAECEVGETPKLPDTVTVTYSNGMEALAEVTWDEVSKMTTSGTNTVKGTITVAGVTTEVTAAITVTSASYDDDYSISRTLNYVKNSGAAYADAIFNIATENTDELTIKVTVTKDGETVKTATKAITNAAELDGDAAYLRVPVTAEGELSVKAELYKTSTPESVISDKTRTITNKASFANTENVTLEDDSLFEKSEEVGLDYILGVDAARLLQPSYEMHGLTLTYESGADDGRSDDVSDGDTVERYGGWERKSANNWTSSGGAESYTLAGESMGHWLSAAAVFYRDIQDETVLKRMNYVIDKLDELQNTDIADDCETATSKEYIGGCPETTFTKCFAGDTTWVSGYWVPWYNVHKVYQGLLDVYDYAPEDTAMKAYEILKKFSDWAVEGTSNLTDAQMQSVLDTEYGGMNEIFARMYEITGKDDYLSAGRRFTHDSIINPLITDTTSSLSGKHANTQIPKFVGAAELYEQDSTTYADYKTACENFWNNVNYDRCYAIGGNSLAEHFQTEGTEELGAKTCESCNTYNMMRLTEHIFSWHYADDDSQYMDWYEKALYNHILGQQNPETGAKMYFVSLMQGHHRIYEDKYNSWWCCTGTGMENPGRYTRTAYFEDNTDSTLYVNLYMAGTYEWEYNGLTFKVETNYPYSDTVKYTVTGGDNVSANVKFRAPSWLASDMTATVGNESYTGKAGTYMSVNRTWNTGDTLTLTLPMSLHLYTPRTDSQTVYEYGPIVLAAELGECEESKRITSNETSLDLTTKTAPYIVTNGVEDPTDEQLLSYVEAVDVSNLEFRIKAENSSTGEAITLIPFTEITDNYHNVYWNVNSAGDEYATGLNNITIDTVEPDGQQDELGHGLTQGSESKDGYYYESNQGTTTINGTSYFWRDAWGSADSFFRYNLAVDGDSRNYLFVRYCGDDTSFTKNGVTYTRDFYIYVDGVQIAEQTLNKESAGSVYDVFYEIPTELTEGKESVVVKFAPKSATCAAGGVLNVRTTSADDPTGTLPESVTVTVDGKTISYTSDYNTEYNSATEGVNMYVALYDSDGVLMQVKLNVQDDSFTVTDAGSYTIKAFFWDDDMSPIYDYCEKTVTVE